MSTFNYKLLWFLIHLLFHFFEIIFSVIVFIYSNLEELIIFTSKFKFYSNIDYDENFINNIKPTLNKIPNHVVIILSDDKFSENIIKRLIKYCQLVGIKYISFYDYKGLYMCHKSYHI